MGYQPQKAVNGKFLWEVLKDIDMNFEKYGNAYAIGWLLDWLGKPVYLGHLAKLLSIARGVEVSETTVSNALRRMRGRGLVVQLGGGLWAANQGLPSVHEAAKYLVDHRKVRSAAVQNFVLRQLRKLRVEAPRQEDEPRLPMPVLDALKRAKEVAERYSREAALAYLAHTLLPVRRTGVLLWWTRDGEFVFKERKTGFYHAIRMPKVAEFLMSLGLRPGRVDPEQFRILTEGIASTIKAQYGSFQSARRVHYQLKFWALNSADPSIAKQWYQEGEDMVVVEVPPPAPGLPPARLYVPVSRSGELTSNSLQLVQQLWQHGWRVFCEWCSPQGPEAGLEHIAERLKKKDYRVVGAVIGREHAYEDNDEAYF